MQKAANRIRNANNSALFVCFKSKHYNSASNIRSGDDSYFLSAKIGNSCLSAYEMLTTFAPSQQGSDSYQRLSINDNDRDYVLTIDSI